ncbi:aquaporin-like protein [Crucibulum laeve]|uniref:Aquaporin-like protein n=1 Tax=Crucibulum laeve TaxID=68775 RepID=A0A5C3M426_9AGAR|nr:aquaporin-like protein [Crucibulum laeve]
MPVNCTSRRAFYSILILLHRTVFMEYASEFFGTMILVIFGTGANCQAILGSSKEVAAFSSGDWSSLSLGWATAVALGVWVSGGHVNPAVTIAFATWRDFPWRKVPGYIVAQLLGGVVGAAITYGTYSHAIDIVEGGAGIRTLKTAGLFGTLPASYLPAANAFFAEFLATAMFLFGIMMFTDPKNKTCLPSPALPGGLFVLVLGIATALGMQTGFAINPARDLGPRMLTAMVGYGSEVFTARNHYWIWCPIVATICGAQAGTLAYDLFLFKGDEGVVQKL